MGFFDRLKRRDPISEHSTRIFACSVQAGNAARGLLQERGEVLDDTAWFGVVMEYLNFHLHLTDRALFGKLDEHKRKSVMDDLCLTSINSAVSACCHGWGVDLISKVQGECMQNYIKSSRDYGACKSLVPEADHGAAGTLIWEFSKVVAEIAGHPLDAAYVVLFGELIDFEGLKIKKFVSDMGA